MTMVNNAVHRRKASSSAPGASNTSKRLRLAQRDDEDEDFVDDDPVIDDIDDDDDYQELPCSTPVVPCSSTVTVDMRSRLPSEASQETQQDTPRPYQKNKAATPAQPPAKPRRNMRASTSNITSASLDKAITVKPKLTGRKQRTARQQKQVQVCKHPDSSQIAVDFTHMYFTK